MTVSQHIEPVEGEKQQPLLLTVRELQATRRDQMAKKFNAAHHIHTFKMGDIVTVAIPAKDRAVNDAPRTESRNIDIPHENRHTLQTEYGVLSNSYPTSELNQVPAELAGSLQRKLTDISLPSTQLTIHKATALRSPALTVPVKCKCRTKCDTRRCNCKKQKVHCTQYCHSGHLACGNLPDSIAKQTEVPLVSRREEAVDNPPSKRKRQAQTPTSKPAKKRAPVDQSLPLPIFATSRGLRPSIPTSLATRSKSNKSLIDYPNTAGVAVQLQSLRARETNSEIHDTAHQLTLTQMSTDGKTQGGKQ